MNWRICIDSPQKRALDLCSGTMNKGRGSGYDWNYGSGSGVRPARGFGDGVGSGGFGDGEGSGSERPSQSRWLMGEWRSAARRSRATTNSGTVTEKSKTSWY
jgi:hypothetical protein